MENSKMTWRISNHFSKFSSKTEMKGNSFDVVLFFLHLKRWSFFIIYQFPSLFQKKPQSIEFGRNNSAHNLLKLF